MVGINLICVGKLKEEYFADAVSEYSKRLSSYCRLKIIEVSEVRLGANASDADLEAALKAEAADIAGNIPKGAYTFALCIEGKGLSSDSFSHKLSDLMTGGESRLAFLVGGSNGLHNSVKQWADYKLSMSEMTFPHHLARIMLLEQIYRSFKILEGSKYHK